jgi:outer membrane protein
MQEEETINTNQVEDPIGKMAEEQTLAATGGKKPPFFAFNLGTLLGALAFIGVIFLFFQNFLGEKSQPVVPQIPIQKTTGKSLSVVFVNTDSLNEHYDFVKTLRNDLEGHGKKLQTEVLNEQAALEKEAAEFQKKMASNQITEEKAKIQYEQLMQRQQVLMEKKDRYTQQVAEMELKMNIKLVDSVTAFLKRFNRNYNFDYILTYKTAGEILVANDTLDITQTVLEALNQEYRQRKK